MVCTLYDIRIQKYKLSIFIEYVKLSENLHLVYLHKFENKL